jgi:hypothetical protein
VFGERLVDRLADDSTDVLGLEDARIDLHEVLFSGLVWAAGDCRQRTWQLRLARDAVGTLASSAPKRSQLHNA